MFWRPAMIALAHTLLPASLAAPFRRLGSATGAALGSVATRLRHRHEIRNLAEFDDRMLSDIGLTRSEVEGALAEPFFRDRAVFLVRWNEQPMRSPLVKAPEAVRPAVRLHPSAGFRA
jgi:uncharacterized protein YjiS (DUF1127 family)